MNTFRTGGSPVTRHSSLVTAGLLAGLLLVAGMGLPAAAADKNVPVETYRRGANDKVELAVRPDGTADLAIETQSPRGVCGLSLSGRRQAPGSFVFRDTESTCTVSLAVTDQAIKVSSSGDCSSYCGVHAFFTGAYGKSKPPAAKGKDVAFAPVAVEHCGKPLAMDLRNPAQFRQFGVDLAAFRKNEAAKYAASLASMCKSSTKYRALVESKIDRIALVNAQGAMEPTPYFSGKTLIIEFFGGDFDAREFDRALRRALDGKPPVARD